MDLSSDPEDLTGLSESVRVNSTSVMGKGLGGGGKGEVFGGQVVEGVSSIIMVNLDG